MKHILTLVLAMFFISNIKAQSQLEQEFIEDYSKVDTILQEASLFAYDCSNSALFLEKIYEASIYYDERIIYYSNLDEGGPKFLELGASKSNFLYYIENNLHKVILDFNAKASKYIMLCKEMDSNLAIENEEDIKEIIEVYDHYKALSDGYSSIYSQIDNYTSSLKGATDYPEEITCELLESVKQDCDSIDKSIEKYLAYVDSANIKFYALSERHQTLKISRNNKIVPPDSKDDTESEKAFKEVQRGMNERSGGKYMLFEEYKGMRIELSYEDKYTKYIQPYNKLSTSKIREITDKWLKEKGCI